MTPKFGPVLEDAIHTDNPEHIRVGDLLALDWQAHHPFRTAALDRARRTADPECWRRNVHSARKYSAVYFLAATLAAGAAWYGWSDYKTEASPERMAEKQATQYQHALKAAQFKCTQSTQQNARAELAKTFKGQDGKVTTFLYSSDMYQTAIKRCVAEQNVQQPTIQKPQRYPIILAGTISLAWLMGGIAAAMYSRTLSRNTAKGDKWSKTWSDVAKITERLGNKESREHYQQAAQTYVTGYTP